MKKLFLLTLFPLISSAGSNLYFGADLVAGSETFHKEETYFHTSTDSTSPATALRLEGGVGSRDGWGIELALNFINYGKEIYSNNDGTNTVFDIDIIRAFDINGDIYPFFKFGLGFGAMELDGYPDESVGNLSVQFGCGLFIALTPQIDLDLGLMLRGRDWQDVSVYGIPVEITSSAFEPHLGVNYRF